MNNPPVDIWFAEPGEKFEAWWKQLKEQAEAAHVYGPIGIELFKPLADQGEAVIIRTMYIMRDGSKIPGMVGPFKRDKDANIRYVDPANKLGTIVTYYLARKHGQDQQEPAADAVDEHPDTSGTEASS